ncbi:hypothetical protein PCASD_26258 [Puccinia coronata f. sp. avenae]|uniref:Uncharacterized protein n=1 Tax=Puccinia coronata f. sp. avenae TaxID=200324 RepID=A0A2N5RU46_9BASI|nr:hypothetical protein PCASD_26258 [Puccinia coronata f. sp. avenae]
MISLLSKRYARPGLPSWPQPLVRITPIPRPQQEQLLEIELDYSSLQALPDTPPPQSKATLPSMDLPPYLQIDSMQPSCPSILGLNTGFTPFQSSYTRPDFDSYRQYHQDEQNQDHPGYYPLHNADGTYDQQNATSRANAPQSAIPQLDFPPALQTTHVPNSTGFPGTTTTGHPDLQQKNNRLATSGTSVPNSLTSSISTPIPSCQPQRNLPSQPAPTPHTSSKLFNLDSNVTVLRKQALRAKLSAHLVEAARGKTLDELIKLVGNDSKYVRLTAENQLQLNKAYMEYQRQLYLIAYKNKLDMEPCLQGQQNLQRQNLQCAQLWHLLDTQTQEKWKDPKFLQSFQSCSDGICETNDLPNQPDQPNQPKPKDQPRTSFETDTWANKVVADLRNLSQRSGIEGFLVIASRGKGKFDAFNGGSHLGK